MDFNEAVNSLRAGKKVKRPDWRNYIEQLEKAYRWVDSGLRVSLDADDIEATDWEIYVVGS